MSSLRIVKKNKSYSVYHDDSYIGFIYKKDFKDLAIRFSEEGEFFIEDTSPETIEAVLNIFRIHACRTECEVIDYLLSQERRQEDE